MEDTRQAVLEARRAGLMIPFCVTIDRQAGDYLPHLFGRHGYTVARRPPPPQVLTRLYAGLTG